MIKSNIILLGAPGSGKGSLAKKLVEVYKYAHVSTGDLFRKEIASNSELGNKLKNIISSGALVEDDITNAVMKNELTILTSQNKNFILDGYPRTIQQAEFLDNISNIDVVILLSVNKDLAVKRIIGRRICPVCGRIYNIYFNKPKVENICDYDGALLFQRKDDNLETIENRFDVYEKQTKPLIEYYKKAKKLHIVKGDSELNITFKDVVRLIE